MPGKEPEIYDLPDDGGGGYTCKECKLKGAASVMILICTPNGKRAVYHRDCIDADWLEIAHYRGMAD